MPNIQNLVVLMLENASFDRILGFSRPWSPAFERLTGTESNPLDPHAPLQTKLAVSPLPFDDYAGYVTSPDPHHELSDVTLQVFGGGAPVPGAANNLGFVVFDHWFASVPGPTWPNRWFAHCATSGGHSESPSDATSASSEIVGMFPMPTIFEALAKVGRSWKVYYHDVPQALSLSRLHSHRDHFKHFGSFLRDAQNGTLPSYAFIEPAYFNLPELGIHANDMHPPHDARLTDKLVADVYNALRAGPSWNQTALLVVWDEHGGFFDHVPPPDGKRSPLAVPPDAASSAATAFKFDRLGVRVPAILASPYAPRGAVVSDLFDHCAIPATIRALFGTGAALTTRDEVSNRFDRALSLDAPRVTPGSIPYTSSAGPPSETTPDVLTGAQRHLLALANGLDVQGLATAATSSITGSVTRVARFLDA